MAHAWVLVANQSQARLFEADNRAGALRETRTLIHPESRLNGRDMESDAPGRAFDSYGQGRHAMGNSSELHHREGQEFAREIAHALERGRVQGQYDKLYIVADPKMVGSLREAMKDTTRSTIAGEMGKNLVDSDIEQIRRQLPDWL